MSIRTWGQSADSWTWAGNVLSSQPPRRGRATPPLLPSPPAPQELTHLFGFQHLVLKDIGDAVPDHLQATGTVGQGIAVTLHDGGCGEKCLLVPSGQDLHPQGGERWVSPSLLHVGRALGPEKWKDARGSLAIPWPRDSRELEAAQGWKPTGTVLLLLQGSFC